VQMTNNGKKKISPLSLALSVCYFIFLALVYVMHLLKTSRKSRDSVSRYWAETRWEAFFKLIHYYKF